MKKITWILALLLFIVSCHKEDVSIPPGLNGGKYYLSEVWTNGVLTETYEYANGKMIRSDDITFDYITDHMINIKRQPNGSVATYGTNNQLLYVHYFFPYTFYVKNDDLLWDGGKLIQYRSTFDALLSETETVDIDSFRYNGDYEVEIRTYWERYVHNVKTGGGFSGSRTYTWHNPFLLREKVGDNSYKEYRYSPVVKDANYNIVNFPWLTNKIGIEDKGDLMNMLIANSFTVGYKRVGSRMLMLEEREVVNGKSMVVRRVENLTTNKEKLPVSYDLKDMGTGTVTHYEFKYVTL